ncbi:hypothetical protein MANY_53900 [Mycolicibacterium anyangense]|jgi:uncharacterized membrane protein|uniref:DUF2273 domain-containing protein n=1 Tax=Mycolicibacterium anyangense TaxID=1431246 RepID=A0A6N4WHY3_9MYCO|nr:DUF2273 domain-containing protein [Mycolicibacterium anyangense]BBZ80053.1 hypothetical protein MANY_53900 [Mycolicibacterium anyangense]
MTSSTLGLIVGLLLGLAAAAGGLWGFVIALLLGAVGYALGAHRDGELDIAALLRGRKRD